MDPGTSRPAARAAPTACDWSRVVAQTVHPLKVAVVEALLWIREPLTRAELAAVVDDLGFDLEAVRYHVNGLVELGLLEVTGSRQVRGGRESYYFLTEDALVE